MANPTEMNFPTPPASPDLVQMHKWMLSVQMWMRQGILNGVQTPFYSQAQLNQMNELTQAGKIFFNNDTGKFNGGEVSGGALVIKEFATV